MQVENTLIVDGRKNDIFHQIAKRKEADIPIAIPLIIIDIPRSAFNNMSYSAIESIKNGLVSSGKYEGGQYTFKSPHVYIFANSKPDENKFSDDRWRVKEVVDLVNPPTPPPGGDPPPAGGGTERPERVCGSM